MLELGFVLLKTKQELGKYKIKTKQKQPTRKTKTKLNRLSKIVKERKEHGAIQVNWTNPLSLTTNSSRPFNANAYS